MSNIQEQVNAVIDGIENPDHICYACGVHIEADDIEENGHECPDCGSDDVAPMSAGDYLNDVLDIEYILGMDRQYLGARVLVCFGGPNVWVNTRTNTVEGHWWSESYSASFTDELGLDDYLSEMWECGA